MISQLHLVGIQNVIQLWTCRAGTLIGILINQNLVNQNSADSQAGGGYSIGSWRLPGLLPLEEPMHLHLF